MHGSNGLKCFKLMPQNDFICQNIFKCSKTIFDQVLKFIYGLKDLEKSLVNYWNEKKKLKMVEWHFCQFWSTRCGLPDLSCGRPDLSCRPPWSTESAYFAMASPTASVVRSTDYTDWSTKLDRNCVKWSKTDSFLWSL